MNVDPFDEFKYLAIRQDKMLAYLENRRRFIDSRFSDEYIMLLFDMGLDAEAVCEDHIIEYEKQSYVKLPNKAN